MGTRARACALMVLAFCLVLVGVPATAAEQADDFVALPFTTYGDMLVDSAHQQVFVTAGYGSNDIAVVHLDGSGTTMVGGAPGATAMAMSQDGRYVYVTLRNGDGIAQVDTSTLELRRFDTGPNSCPTEVAPVGGYVWFVASGDDCNQWTTLRRLDPTTGAVSGDLGSSGYQPALRVVPGTTRFVSAETGISSAYLRLYEVGDGTLQQVASTQVQGYLTKDVRLTNDGGHLMVGRYGGVAFYRLSDFAADGFSTFSDGWSGQSVADDQVVAGALRDAGRVEVVPRGKTGQLNAIDLGPGTGNTIKKLELVGDQLFALTLGSTLRLYQVDRPAAPAPSLSLQLPASTPLGSAVTVTGVLDYQGTPIPGAVVTVHQQGVDQPLGSPTTDAEGHFSLDWVPPTAGTIELSADFAGDATHKATAARATLTVLRAPVDLTLAGPSSVPPGEPVQLTGALFDDGEALDGVSLALQRRCRGSSSWQSLGTVLTDAGGTFTTTDTPGSCDGYDYSVAFAGDEQRAPASAVTSVTVSWVRPSVDLALPDSAHVGDTVDVAGTLSSAEGPLADAALVVRVSTPQGWRSLGEVTTDSTGWFATTDAPTTAGSHCYVVSYAGDSTSLAASGSRCVGVTKHATVLTLDVPSTAALDDPVTVTGLLTSDGDALPGVEVTLSRSDRFLGTQSLGTVTTGADGGFSISDLPPNGGPVTYAASYAGTSTRAAASRTSTVEVARPQRTLEVRTDHAAYGYGDTAQVTVDLTTDSWRTVRVYAEESGRARTMIFSGVVPESGLVLQSTMSRNTVFSAFVPEDGRALDATASVAATTRADLASRLRGSYDTSGRYHLYRPSADPRLTTTISPARDGGCVSVEVQRRSSARGWRDAGASACLPIADSATTWTFDGKRATGTPYRVRPVLAGDLLNAASTGGWLYLRFV